MTTVNNSVNNGITTKNNNSIITSIKNMTDKVTNALETAVDKIAAGSRRSLPGIVTIVIILFALKFGAFDRTPQLKTLIEGCINLVEWAAGLILRFLMWILQGPLVGLGDIMFPPLG